MKKILSLFDGMSCGQIAINRLGIVDYVYYSSEIDKYAMKVTQENFPKTIQLGNILKWRDWNIPWEEIDLVLAGFPCQSWSVAGNGQGDKDPRGKLFWTMLEIVHHIKTHNPRVKFMFENVRMKDDFEKYLTYHIQKSLGAVNKYLIDSALVSAQNRKRYYWTNIEVVTMPKDRGVNLGSVINHNITDYKIPLGVGNMEIMDYLYSIGSPKYADPYNKSALKNKSNTLRTNINNGNMWVLTKKGYRNLTRSETEKLQTVPEGYTSVVSEAQAKKMLSNGWTVDIIVHILKGLFNRGRI